ncbi:uncharacterized protein BP01DRAFT_357553 [Aspergillus saccharolyticus JOP 1030-1]|uniref:C6 transcription factor n=1 Tax=Aspergillus saccharolyticus JOP 1030-1 TaxID=1450539 RepID=A0A318ZDB9_9EURO|nr:hypothetical protein BP01DRAFT_357553 [Aspergillus saccharolyticus JOP 1030-1]PYH44567.1 hypothetical protein BP01DRAFT_357553 [Aspergillus saccharolyticus JOP 1030-1]
MSALHLSHYGPRERRQLYTEAAMTHNNTALALYSPLLNRVNPENCHALFAFSCFVPMFAFAAHGPNVESKSHSVSEVIEVFKLIRGAAFVVTQARPWIASGGMSRLLTVERMRERRSVRHHATAIYHLLHRLHEEQQQQQQRQRGLDSSSYRSANSVVVHATESLLNVLQMCADNENGSVLLRWTAIVQSTFLDSLTQDEPMGLVLLGYFGAAIDFIIDNWWMDGWGRYLINLVSDRLRAGADSQEVVWARYAMHQLESSNIDKTNGTLEADEIRSHSGQPLFTEH